MVASGITAAPQGAMSPVGVCNSVEQVRSSGFAWLQLSLRSMFDSGYSSHRIVALEGMRGFAALFVFFVHFYSLFGSYARPQSLLRGAMHFAGQVGNTGVDIFFVISGFLMYGIVIRKPTPFLKYFARRVRRLYPVFLVVFFIYVVISLTVPSESRIPPALGPGLGYILANLAMLPGMLSIKPLITVAWSLSYEWFFYLILPLSVWALDLRRWTPGKRVALVLTICTVQSALCFAHVSSHQRLIMFGAGICLWELTTCFDVAPYLGFRGELAAIAIAIMGVAWVGRAAMLHNPGALSQTAMLPVAAPILFFSIFGLTLYSLFFHGVLNKLFSLTFLRWMGNISYSYYLCHGLTLHVLAKAMHAGPGSRPLSPVLFVILAALSLLATIVVGALLFLTIEKPLSLSSAAATGEKGNRTKMMPEATAPRAAA